MSNIILEDNSRLEKPFNFLFFTLERVEVFEVNFRHQGESMKFREVLGCP